MSSSASSSVPGSPGYVLSVSVLERKCTLYFHSLIPRLCFCAVERKAEHGVPLSVSKTPVSRCCSSAKWTALAEALRSTAKQRKKEMKMCRLSLTYCFTSSFARNHHGSPGSIWARAISLVS